MKLIKRLNLFTLFIISFMLVLSFLFFGRKLIQPIKGKANSNKFTTRVFAKGLNIPWTLMFTSPNRLLVAERGGDLKHIINSKLSSKPIHTFEEVAHYGEAGLMGMTKDVNYPQNKYLYFCMSYKKNNRMINKIVRAIDKGDSIDKIKVLIDNLPSAQFHAGCRIAFGPDKKLYVTTGDVSDKGLAQNKRSLAGKILRYNIDGSIPSDNPFPGSSVYTLGHRNSQGIAWNKNGDMYETEHGPSGFDGPGGGDEINRILRGQNYGWPIVHHTEEALGFIHPLLVMTPAEAPAGAIFYSGRMFGQWREHLFFGALKGEGLMKVKILNNKVVSKTKLFSKKFGRIRDVIEDERGRIYFATSNRDGRGKIQRGDDTIIIVEKK